MIARFDVKKIFIALNIMLLIYVSSVTPARAAAPAIVIGGVEIGALAIWGGAALIATGYEIVGAKSETSEAIREFGRIAWYNANDYVKESISSSLTAVKEGWNTTERFVVEYTNDVSEYLRQQWTEFFGKGYVVNESGELLKIATMGGTFHPSAVEAIPSYTGTTRNDLGMLDNTIIKAITVDEYGRATVVFYTGTLAKWKNLLGANDEPFANAMAAYAYLASTYGITKIASTIDPTFNDYGGKPYTIPTFPDVYPNKLNMPAIGGTLNPDGTIAGYKEPTFGRVGGIAGGDIAVGYPSVPGDYTSLKETDSITANPATDIPTDGTIDFSPPTTSTNKINWAPMKLAVGVFTTKFPFSIPWDIKKQLDIFNVAPKAPQFEVNAPSFLQLGSITVPLRFTIDLSSFDLVATIIRWFLTIAFDLAIILSMRRIMPE